MPSRLHSGVEIAPQFTHSRPTQNITSTAIMYYHVVDERVGREKSAQQSRFTRYANNGFEKTQTFPTKNLIVRALGLYGISRLVLEKVDPRSFLRRRQHKRIALFRNSYCTPRFRTRKRRRYRRPTRAKQQKSVRVLLQCTRRTEEIMVVERKISPPRPFNTYLK